jgi:hypothetical protein
MPAFAALQPVMRTLLALLSLLIFVTACHKKDVTSASQVPGSDATIAGQPTAPLPPPSKAVAANAENNVRENVAGEVDQFLTSQLKIFVQDKGRLPGSFAEFARARLDSIPRPPAGTKWVIDAPTQPVNAMPVK